MNPRKPIVALLVVGLVVVLALSFVPYSLLLSAKQQMVAVITRSDARDLTSEVKPLAPATPAFDVAAWYASQEEEPEKHGVLIETLDGKSVLASHNADTTFNPASLIKLATSLVALKRLGANYRFETRVYAEGTKDEKGTLQGKIYVVGNDPIFGDVAGALIARELRARGINDATEGVFVSPEFCFNYSESPEDSAQRLVKVMDFDKAGAAQNKRAAKEQKEKKEKKAKEADAGKRKKKDAREKDRKGTDKKSAGENANGRTDVAQGTEAEQEEIDKQNDTAGQKVGPHVAQTPPDGKPLFILRSYPLREVLLYMNAHSSNFVAERLAALFGGAQGVERFLVEELRLPVEQVTIARASGREHNRMTPRGLLTTIRALHAEAARQGMKLEDIMPVASDDAGTLRRRLAGTPLEGSLVGKTGTLTHEVDGGMASLAGIVYTQKAGLLVFAILDQGSRISENRELEDQLLNQVIISQDTPINLKRDERRKIFTATSLEISDE
ncbi:MAG TPA: D-alanyl-D-alanine carboxypeptidase [Pyrinomonadaceae bacterium]|nr:D-alanyl-D-alanine carboxypeptidase [Pyrinomonadaceae bacterium]